MLIELTIDEVAWCPQGHPVLLLQEIGGPRQVAIALTVEDAQALSPHPEAYQSGRARFCDTFADALLRAGARLIGVELATGPRGVLQAHIQACGATGAFSVPAHAADGFILACRQHLPLWVAAETMLRIATVAERAVESRGPIAPIVAPAATPPAADPLAPFRRVIEGLDWPDLPDA